MMCGDGDTAGEVIRKRGFRRKKKKKKKKKKRVEGERQRELRWMIELRFCVSCG